MNNYYAAIKATILKEGGFVDRKDDPGGATNFGISLRFMQSINPKATVDTIKELTEPDATMIYKKYWWDKYNYGALLNDNIAAKIFDLSVNMGPKSAHICAQRALRAASGTVTAEDGILGPMTIKCLNVETPAVLLASIKSEAAGYYRSLNKPMFINGWLNRAYS